MFSFIRPRSSASPWVIRLTSFVGENSANTFVPAFLLLGRATLTSCRNSYVGSRIASLFVSVRAVIMFTDTVLHASCSRGWCSLPQPLISQAGMRLIEKHSCLVLCLKHSEHNSFSTTILALCTGVSAQNALQSAG